MPRMCRAGRVAAAVSGRQTLAVPSLLAETTFVPSWSNSAS